MAFGDGFSMQSYAQSHGPDLYRRGLYTFWKRTNPPASLATFDAPDREKCTARRTLTNTPLQALVLMNDPTYVEAARALAQRALLEGGRDVDGRIAFAFRLATARQPSAEEMRRAAALLARRLAGFRRDKKAARDLVGRRRMEIGPEARRERAGGVVDGLEHHPEPRRDDHQGMRRWTSTGELDLHITRRQLFGLTAKGIGVGALASLMGVEALAAGAAERDPRTGGLIGLPHFAPKAKRVIFLHQSGGPSQLETFDYKPMLDQVPGHADP